MIIIIKINLLISNMHMLFKQIHCLYPRHPQSTVVTKTDIMEEKQQRGIKTMVVIYIVAVHAYQSK